MTTLKITADNAAEASAKYSKARDDSGEGASTFPVGVWGDLRISYNGKIWAPGADMFDAALVFDPFA